MTTAPSYDNSVRIGYARVSTRTQEHQAQLDALAAAHCREIITETASTRGDRPKLREALAKLQAGDTLVIYKPDRVARSMKELLVLLEDQLHARGINLHILTGICAGIHRPDGATIADKMLFMVAAMAAEMERDLIRERTLDGLRAAQAQGRRGGRPPAVDDDVLAVARARQSRGESVTAIARHLKIGRSTLYRALQPREGDLVSAAMEPTRVRRQIAPKISCHLPPKVTIMPRAPARPRQCQCQRFSAQMSELLCADLETSARPGAGLWSVAMPCGRHMVDGARPSEGDARNEPGCGRSA